MTSPVAMATVVATGVAVATGVDAWIAFFSAATTAFLVYSGFVNGTASKPRLFDRRSSGMSASNSLIYWLVQVLKSNSLNLIHDIGKILW